MLNTVYLDEPVDDAIRRERLYGGQIFLFSATETTTELVDWARAVLFEAFAPHDPREAQHAMPVEEFVRIFAAVKPAFMHHPRTMALLRELIAERGCDLQRTYLDVPRLRGVTSHGYLSSGVGYAHPLHRDTWWAAPMAQLNWWLPLFPIESSSSMAFHPDWWDRPIANGSEDFDYYRWNATGRADAAKHIHADTRKQPGPREPIGPDPQIRFVVPPGAVVLFSAAQMHSTVANVTGVTRFSIDFRTVNLDDVRSRTGAANVDSLSPSTSLRDFRRAADGAAMPEEVARLYDDRDVDAATAVFRPGAAGQNRRGVVGSSPRNSS